MVSKRRLRLKRLCISELCLVLARLSSPQSSCPRNHVLDRTADAPHACWTQFSFRKKPPSWSGFELTATAPHHQGRHLRGLKYVACYYNDLLPPGEMQYADSVAPDQPANPHSMIGELHCPFIRRMWFQCIISGCADWSGAKLPACMCQLRQQKGLLLSFKQSYIKKCQSLYKIVLIFFIMVTPNLPQALFVTCYMWTS